MRKLIFAAIVICNMWAAPASACQKCFDELVECLISADTVTETVSKNTEMTADQLEKYNWGMKFAFRYAIKRINEIHPETHISIQEWEDICQKKQ